MTRILAIGLALAFVGCDSGGGDTDEDATDTVEETTDTVGDTDSDTPTDTAVDTAVDTESDTESETGCAVAGDCDDDDPCTMDSCNTDDGTCEYDPTDADGDGFVAVEVDGTTCAGNDCDDDDDAVYPDAPVGCAVGDDFDCDTMEDRDEDEDGYITDECTDGDDCDDNDADAFPGSVLIECVDLDRDCNGNEDQDNDGDGQNSQVCLGSDCDDTNPDVRFGIDEDTCDGVDTNCDGVMAAEEDTDNDGVANAACAAPGADVDCNDLLATTYPGATEICDEEDNNCDGSWADGGADDDGDTVLDETCGGDDCDDMEATAYLGATEVCNDDIDQDCDGWVDGPEERIGETIIASGTTPAIVWNGGSTTVCWRPTGAGHITLSCWAVPLTGPDTTRTTLMTTSTDGPIDPVAIWTGTEMGVAWQDIRDGNYEIYFKRVTASGGAITSEMRITDEAASSQRPSVEWSGSEYAVAWTDFRDGVDEHVYFARIHPDTGKIGSDIQITDLSPSNNASLEWSGSEWGLAWQDQRDGGLDIYFAHLDATGTKIGSDSPITIGPSSAQNISMEWSGSEFAAVWAENSTGQRDIYFARIDTTGSVVGSNIQLTDTAGDSMWPYIMWADGSYFVVWEANRDGNPEIYFVRLDPTGIKTSPEMRISDGAWSSTQPRLAWTGSEMVVAWQDSRSGDFQVLLSYISFCD